MIQTYSLSVATPDLNHYTKEIFEKFRGYLRTRVLIVTWSWVKKHKKLMNTTHPSLTHPSLNKHLELASRVKRSWEVTCICPERNALGLKDRNVCECVRSDPMPWGISQMSLFSFNTCVCEWKNDRSQEKWEDAYIRRSRVKPGVCLVCFAARESFILKCRTIHFITVFSTSCFNALLTFSNCMHESFQTNRERSKRMHDPKRQDNEGNIRKKFRGRRQDWIRTRQLLPIVFFSPFPFFTASLISPPLVLFLSR